MTEEGTVSIIRRGLRYQVRYASNNPYGREWQPWTSPDEAHVRTLLHHLVLRFINDVRVMLPSLGR